MDEEALRAMLPMGFGKQLKGANRNGGGNRPSMPPPAADWAPMATSSSNSEASSSSKHTLAVQKKPIQGPARGPINAANARRAQDARARAEDEDDGEDDGLTAEERAANAAATNGSGNGHSRLGRGEDSDDDDKGGDDDDDDDGGDDSSVDLGPEPLPGPSSYTLSLPLSSHIHLSSHTKPLSALSVDPSGARVATGSYDYDVKLWDFGGMTSSFQPLKTFEPFGSYWIHDLAWSVNGEQLLAVSGTSQAKLFDRNGNETAHYKKGDVYIRDMKQTTGHVAEISSCSWVPGDAHTFATASADSTIRLWDPEETLKQKTVVVVKSKGRGTRTKVTSHAFSHDGKTLAAGCTDGALHLWSTSGSYQRPNSTVENAHVAGSDVTSLAFAATNNHLTTRSGDGTVKLWDTRSLRSPLATRADLPNLYAQTSVIFSADEKHILTGSSTTSPTNPGKLHILSRLDLSEVDSFPIPPAPATSSSNSSSIPAPSPIRLQHHPKINHVFLTTSHGTCTAFYSPTQSIRGVLLCLDKHSSKRRTALASGTDEDLEAFADQPLFLPSSSSTSTNKKRPSSSSSTYAPTKPLTGPGRGGRIGSSATAHMVQELYRDHLDVKRQGVDSREVLLGYEGKVREDKERELREQRQREQNKKVKR